MFTRVSVAAFSVESHHFFLYVSVKFPSMETRVSASVNAWHLCGNTRKRSGNKTISCFRLGKMTETRSVHGKLGARSIQPKFRLSDGEKWSTSKGGPVFSKPFQLDRTDPLSFGPKFPEILVEWIAPQPRPRGAFPWLWGRGRPGDEVDRSLDHHVSAGRKRDRYKQLPVSVKFTKYGNTLFRPVFKNVVDPFAKNLENLDLLFSQSVMIGFEQSHCKVFN